MSACGLLIYAMPRAGARSFSKKFCTCRNLIAVKCPRENKLDVQDTSLLQIFALILVAYLIARGIIWLVQRYHDARGCGSSFKNLLREGKLDASVYADAVWSEFERFGKRRLRSKIAKRQRKLIRKVKNELRASYLSACTPSLYQYIIIFLISSVLGLLLETVYTLVVFGVLESRVGLIWDPFSPLYGCGAVLLTALLWEARDWPA